MRPTRARTIVCVLVFGLGVATTAGAQTMEKVDYFPDSISEKDDHVVKLNGGSSWLLANPTPVAAVAADVMVVMRDVLVNGQHVPAAWLYVAGEEIPIKHVEGVFPKNAAFLTRVVAAENRGSKLRLADGTELVVPGYNNYYLNRLTPPYKVLLSSNRLSLVNLKDGRRVGVQPAK